VNGPLVEHQKIAWLQGRSPVFNSGITVHHGDVGIGECRRRPRLDVDPSAFDCGSLDGLGRNGKFQTGSVFADWIDRHPEDTHGTSKPTKLASMCHPTRVSCRPGMCRLTVVKSTRSAGLWPVNRWYISGITDSQNQSMMLIATGRLAGSPNSVRTLDFNSGAALATCSSSSASAETRSGASAERCRSIIGRRQAFVSLEGCINRHSPSGVPTDVKIA
jgi:hypothetical protein